MDLKTSYIGLELETPFIAGASPLSKSLDSIRQLEDGGASALVMHSLFEEQITRDELSMHHHSTAHEQSHAEAMSYLPSPDRFVLGPDEYVEQVSRAKKAISIPVIGSLNGISQGGWTRYAKLIQEAGADALELNIYYLALDPEETGEAVEQRYVDVLEAVKATVTIPIAVKLSPFFSAPMTMARRLVQAGAQGLVLFNRFYQPDIDIDALDVVEALQLSSPDELRLRLRWLAALFGNVECSLAATGGIHSGRDALKALMAGANAVQVTSALLRQGPKVLATMRDEMATWLEEKEYESARQGIGSMSLNRCPDPNAFERANYMKVLQSWRYGTTS